MCAHLTKERTLNLFKPQNILCGPRATEHLLGPQRGQTPVLGSAVLISLLTALRAFERQGWVKTKFTNKVLQVKRVWGENPDGTRRPVFDESLIPSCFASVQSRTRFCPWSFEAVLLYTHKFGTLVDLRNALASMDFDWTQSFIWGQGHCSGAWSERADHSVFSPSPCVAISCFGFVYV